LWIKKYEIKDLFSDEYVLTKIIETEYWEMASDIIENSTSFDIKKAVLETIHSAMSKNASIHFILKIGFKFNVINDLSSNKLIKYALERNNYIEFEKLIDAYNITDLEVLKDGIEYFLKSSKVEKILHLIRKYSLNHIFTIDYIYKNFSIELYPKRLEILGAFYGVDSLKNYALTYANDCYNQNQLGLAEQIIEYCNLWSEFTFDNFLQRAFQLKKWGLLTRWHSKYNLKEKYSINDIIQEAVDNNDLHNAYQIAKKFNLEFSDFYEISVGSIVQCKVRKIVTSRVFVKIEGETRPASIYIGELANRYIPNIFDFEYNGKKLHIGQKLIAKVINIDEQDRINLSLKQVKNGE
jgi:hypothetical protein